MSGKGRRLGEAALPHRTTYSGGVALPLTSTPGFRSVVSLVSVKQLL